MSDRDRKILLAVVPLIVIVAYWFLLLAPKRHEATTAKKAATEQTQRLADAKAAAGQANGAKSDFAADYGEIVRLGKAIPSRVDMPSLLVQLDHAALGTGIKFTRIQQGPRTPLVTASTTATPGATGTTPPATGTTGTPASGTTPPAGTTAPRVAAGGTPAQSGPGTATEAANNASATSDKTNAATDAAATDTTTSTSTGGGLPVGGGAATPGAPGATDASAGGGLETVPLELDFVGNFFNLADFFHQVKRFVHVANNSVVVNGRLITIDGVSFGSEQTIFPKIKATLKATVYLSPLSQGTTAGATPAGPATTPAAAGTTTTPPATGTTTTAPAPTSPTPTAAATP
jgi:Tfp pilus assembly protein PilO